MTQKTEQLTIIPVKNGFIVRPEADLHHIDRMADYTGPNGMAVFNTIGDAARYIENFYAVAKAQVDLSSAAGYLAKEQSKTLGLIMTGSCITSQPYPASNNMSGQIVKEQA